MRRAPREVDLKPWGQAIEVPEVRVELGDLEIMTKPRCEGVFGPLVEPAPYL